MVHWFQRSERTPPREKPPLRTVYNAWTQQHEEIPLPEFQHLLKQGEIQETIVRSPDGGRAQTVYRLV